MFNRKLFRKTAVCILAGMLAVQTISPVCADETYDNTEVIEDTGNQEQPPEVTPEPGPSEENPGTGEQEPAPGGNSGTENGEEQETPVEEEKKEVLPISAGIAVSGEAGSLTLVLTVTNATFINENIPDYTAVFSTVPAGVGIGVAGLTENTVTFSITGNAAAYTKTDLVMVIPGNWLKNTGDEVVAGETRIEGHDLYWCAHADFGIRLKSKADTVDNAAFIAQQNLTENKADYDTLHFVYKKMDLKCFSDETEILEYPAEDARVVGIASKDQSVYEIIGIEGGWMYVESGKVRGFVRREQVKAPSQDQKLHKYNTARVVIQACDNKAYDYVRITGYDYVIKEIPRISMKDLDIKEDKDKDSKTVGKLKQNGIVYWLSSEVGGWVYAESGDVRGFVEEKDLMSVKDSAEQIKQHGANSYGFAEKTVEPKDNKAFYYKLLSTKSGSMEAFYREQIVELAKKYIGNPYVYGGTDPVHGIDCSAFMQFLFGTYGISLPRTSKTQGFVSKMIPMDSVDKGDMIIYADDAEIYHVVLSAGDGKTVEAADETQGVCSKPVNTVAAVWGISLLDSADSLTMPSEIAKPDYTYEVRVKDEREQIS